MKTTHFHKYIGNRLIYIIPIILGIILLLPTFTNEKYLNALTVDPKGAKFWLITNIISEIMFILGMWIGFQIATAQAKDFASRSLHPLSNEEVTHTRYQD